MFDDPKKDLAWLEAQLLAEEAPQEEAPEEEWFETEEDWLDAELREAHALMGDAPARSRTKEDIFAFLEEDAAREEAPAYADGPRQAEPKKKKKEKGVGGLVFLACLETLGIIAVLLWWVIWLL